MADPDGERPVIDLLYGSSTLLPTFPKHRKAAGRNSSLRRGLDAEQLAEERERLQRDEEKHKNREERIKQQLLEEEQEKGREDEHEGAKEEQKEELPSHDDDHHEGAVFPIDSFGRDGSTHGDGEIIEQPQRSQTVEGSATIITTPPPNDPPNVAPIVQPTTPQEVGRKKEELNGNERSSEPTEDKERTKTSDSAELNLNILQPIQAPPAQQPQEQRPPSPRGPAQGAHQRYSSLTTPQPDPSSPASPALTYSVRTSAPPSPNNNNKNSNLLNVHPLHSSHNDFRVPAADGNNNRRQHKRNNSTNVVDEKAAEKLKQELLTLRDPKHKIKSYHDRYPLLEDKPKPRTGGGHSPSPSSSTSSYGSYSSSGEPCLSCSLF